MIEYGFIENQDFQILTQKRITNNPKNSVTIFTNHAIKLDMAKEISMIQKSEKGKIVEKTIAKLPLINKISL